MLEQSFTGEITYILGSVFIAFIIDKFVAKFPILCKCENSSHKNAVASIRFVSLFLK